MAQTKRQPFSFTLLKRAEFMAVLAAVIFAAVLAIVAIFTGKDKLINELAKLNIQTALIVFIVPLIGTFLRACRWHVFGEKLQMHVPFKRMMLYYFAGISMIITPGKLGTSLRLWLLKKCHNVPYKKGVPLMVMDPITDLLSLFIICLLGVAGFAGKVHALTIFGIIIAVILISFAKPVLMVNAVKIIYNLTGKKKPRLFASVLKVLRHITTLVDVKVLSKNITLSIVAWMSTIWAFEYLLMTMGTPLPFLHLAFIFSFSIILGGATMAPGGLGGTEASMVALLLAAGVPLETAIATVTILRIGTLWFGVLIGFATLPFALKVAKKRG